MAIKPTPARCTSRAADWFDRCPDIPRKQRLIDTFQAVLDELDSMQSAGLVNPGPCGTWKHDVLKVATSAAGHLRNRERSGTLPTNER